MNYLMIIITLIAFSYVSENDYKDRYERSKLSCEVRAPIQQDPGI